MSTTTNEKTLALYQGSVNVHHHLADGPSNGLAASYGGQLSCFRLMDLMITTERNNPANILLINKV